MRWSYLAAGAAVMASAAAGGNFSSKEPVAAQAAHAQTNVESFPANAANYLSSNRGWHTVFCAPPVPLEVELLLKDPSVWFQSCFSSLPLQPCSVYSAGQVERWKPKLWIP